MKTPPPHSTAPSGLLSGPDSVRELFALWFRIGLLSFGGPTAQIAMMHRELVEERGWLSDRDFLHALNFCLLLPGPEAMQLATYSGWKVAGVRGGVIAGGLFILPGAVVMLALAALYVHFGHAPLAQVLFDGLRAAVLVIVLQALVRLGRKTLHSGGQVVMAGCSFVALFVFDLPFALVILIAGLIGVLSSGPESAKETGGAVGPPVSLLTPLKTAGFWLALWLLPLAGLIAFAGFDSIFTRLALFASKLALVTFGGAYAVLSDMAQTVVQQWGWLGPDQMVDGLGLAETTPGPLILVTEFVGYLSAFYHAEAQARTLAGIAGAGVVLWWTFIPCFLWIFTGAPLLDHITQNPRMRGALGGITTAVTGVILNLSLWFAIQVFFGDSHRFALGPVAMVLPDLSTLDPKMPALALVAAGALIGFKWPIARTLALCAGLSWGVSVVIPAG